MWINSPGGDCVAASQIYTMLMDYPGHVTVKIDGLAASAASVVAMAGTQVLMAPTAMMMVHNPLTVAIGDSDEMQKVIAMLSEVKESILNAYARTMRKDMTKDEFEAWTRDAEQKRDAALEPYARAESEEERQRIAQEVAEALNEA